MDVNLVDKHQYIPLHFAADNGRIDAADKLLDAGADIHVRTKLNYTPLHLAVTRWRQCPDGSLIKLLIDRGTDLSATDINGFTPAVAAQGMVEFPDELNRMLTHG